MRASCWGASASAQSVMPFPPSRGPAVALLGSMLLFIGSSLRRRPGSAIRSAPLALQRPVAPYQAAQSVSTRVARLPGVLQAARAATGPFAAVNHAGTAGLSTAG